MVNIVLKGRIKAMGLQVGLVNHVEPIPTAQLIPSCTDNISSSSSSSWVVGDATTKVTKHQLHSSYPHNKS
jgi:hypothetical protein